MDSYKLERKNIIQKEIFNNKYWDIGFKLYLSDDLLITMFGEDAVQHAEKNSYPKYFKKVFENAILSEDNNYFIDHLLFDQYFIENNELPLYLKKLKENSDIENSKLIENLKFNYILNKLPFKNELIGLKDIKSYDMIDLSNIFDWMDEIKIKQIVKQLSKEMKSDSFLVFRQINNEKEIVKYFEKDFIIDEKICNSLKKKSKSLFYNKINLIIKK
jgi:S-adenosylmethionine-diacylglycerol 3-amino-3-carboxypropyl transferase